MSAWKDLGREYPSPCCAVPSSPEPAHTEKPKQPEKVYPSLYISDVDLALPDSGECRIKFRVVARSDRRNPDGTNTKNLEIEVLAIGTPDDDDSVDAALAKAFQGQM